MLKQSLHYTRLRLYRYLMLFLSFCFISPAFCISESDVIRVGIAGDYAPFAYHNSEGNLEGFDIDAAHQLANILNKKVEFVLTSWPTLSQDLIDNKFDIAMGGISYSKAREELFALSAPILYDGKIALVHCSNVGKFPDLTHIDRNDVKVIVNPGGTNQKFVDSHIKHAKVILTKDNYQNLQAIRDKHADVMITDGIEGRYYQKMEPGIFCVATPTPFDGTLTYKVYMLGKKETALRQKIDGWLQSPEKERLVTRWFN